MDTLQIMVAGAVVEAPMLVGIQANAPVFELVGDVAETACYHAGFGWSSNMYVRCGNCGAPLFVPTRFLARLSRPLIERMERRWSAAGWPEWREAPVGEDAICQPLTDRRCGDWHVPTGTWQLIEDPLFAELGGLPVRLDRLPRYMLELE